MDQHIKNLLVEHLDEQISLEAIGVDQVAAVTDSVVITIGSSAFSRVRQANPDAPIVSLLTERDFLDDYAIRAPGQISGVFYDVPLIRQALTGKAILPQATDIALLATPESVELYQPLIDQLPAYGMSARVFLVDDRDSLIPTLVRALGYGDFLLAAPDSAIYNPRTIKHILLTAYRRNKIVIGPTQAYVQAGSLASSYAPFSEIVQLASEFVETYQKTGKLPLPSYPRQYKVAINKQVGRSLNIPLPDREEIARTVNQYLDTNGETSDE
ncbi:type 1 periplasmic-binding domain-containing protein [Marinobacter subterrani]|uniref:hypothetical protein n=1 Tax=Marinobacter subterrani TaxID=1658765 RepID=UPI001D0D5F35|nr:hypothetical protein [Marinobacter subterrani]